MQAIAIADNNWAVSLKGKPIASIPAERKTMMQEIRGKTIIYDYDYVEELPGQQPVAGCDNLVYIGERNVSVKGAKCFKTFEDMEKALEQKNGNEVYIIFGASTYDHFYEKIDTFHVTKIDYEYRADAHIRNLDADPDFTITADSDEQYCYDILYSFLRYERRKKND